MATYLGLDKHLLVSPRKITAAFVSSDVTTFLIQVCLSSFEIYVLTDPLLRPQEVAFLQLLRQRKPTEQVQELAARSFLLYHAQSSH